MVAETAIKGTVGEAVKDAYKGLKEAVSRWASREVVTLEAAPDSERTKQAVATIVDAQAADEREEVKFRALVLYQALTTAASEGPQGPIAYDIEFLKSAVVSLEAKDIREGTGYRIVTVDAGTFNAKVSGVGKQKR
jgi:hypothetical protein